MHHTFLFRRGSDEWTVGERYEKEFHPLLPAEVQDYMSKKLPWENIRFNPSTRYPANHILAKHINPHGRQYRSRMLKPDSIPALGNAILMQCIWGLRSMKKKPYEEVAKHWGSVLAKLPTSPCSDKFIPRRRIITRWEPLEAEFSPTEIVAGAENTRQSLRVEIRPPCREEQVKHREAGGTGDVLGNFERLLRDARAKEAQLDEERKVLADKEKEFNLALEKLKEIEGFFRKS